LFTAGLGGFAVANVFGIDDAVFVAVARVHGSGARDFFGLWRAALEGLFAKAFFGRLVAVEFAIAGFLKSRAEDDVVVVIGHGEEGGRCQ